MAKKAKEKKDKNILKRQTPYKGLKIPSVFQTAMIFNPNPPIEMKIKGKYACIVVDVNGLSSAFWWDGDRPPKVPYRGYVTVHVRDFTFAWYALAAIGGAVIVVIILILALPDNKEDFDGEEPNENETAAAGKETKTETETPPPTTKTVTESKKPSIPTEEAKAKPTGETHVKPTGETHVNPTGETHVKPTETKETAE